MKRLAVVFFVIALALAFHSYALAADWKEIKAKELKQMMDTEDVLVIFPLSKIEYNNLHIKGSVHITMHDLKTKLPADKNKKLVFYCLGRK